MFYNKKRKVIKIKRKKKFINVPFSHRIVVESSWHVVISKMKKPNELILQYFKQYILTLPND